MKKIIVSLIVLIFTSLSSYSYVGANLDDGYNSFSGGFAFSMGDVNQRQIFGSAIGNLGGNVLIGGQIGYSWIDEIEDVDVDALELEEYQLGFGMGYVIRLSDVLHVVPSLIMGDIEANALGYHVMDADIQQLGFDIRMIQGNRISTIGVDVVEIDNVELVGGVESLLTAQQQALVDEYEESDVIISYAESFYLEDSSSYFQYGFATADFDTISFTFSLVGPF